MLRLFFLLLVSVCAAAVNGQKSTIWTTIENDAVSRFLNEVTYTEKSDTSRVADFLTLSSQRLDLPQPTMVDVPELFLKYVNQGNVSVHYCYDRFFNTSAIDTVFVEKDAQSTPVYDVQPGVTCFYRYYFNSMIIGWGEIEATPQLRMIYVPSIGNVRDIGGWPVADGRTVKYGKLIRGSELNGIHIAEDTDIRHLLHIGVSAEIDLRGNYEDGSGMSVFGFKSLTETADGDVPTFLYVNDSGQLLKQMTKYEYLQRWRQEFEFIVANLRVGRTVYYHCRWGADRTGYLSLLLEGLLGVDYDHLIKDYELTSFRKNSLKTKDMIDPIISFIVETQSGNTLQQKFRHFWTDRVGVSDDDVDYFIDEMLEGEKNEDPYETAVTTVVSSVPASVYYDLSGRRIHGARRGFFLVRQSDGCTRKVVKTNE
ncbi:MAG: tyrosine-protein phosphatase [Prevotella sp.]|nr:tyrosine-protein phosphatase [Prevotella sp.]